MGQILAFPPRPQDRLRAALRSLESALDEQKEAIGALRANLGVLDGAVSGLGTSLQGYRDALADTARELNLTGAAARRLEGAADGWMKTALARPIG